MSDFIPVCDRDHIIDLDADPFCPDSLFSTGEGTEHRKGGKIVLVPGKIRLFLAEGQKNGGYLEGQNLRKELADQPVLNANALDFLMANQELIPEEWKDEYIPFWGTIYRLENTEILIVRCLFWDDARDVACWNWRCSLLSERFNSFHKAAVLAS